ncbi:MAG: hypothetical protein ABIA63_01175, partial [bacterium]
GLYNYQNINADKLNVNEAVGRHIFKESLKLGRFSPSCGFSSETRKLFNKHEEDLVSGSKYNEMHMGLNVTRLWKIDNSSEFVWRRDHILHKNTYRDSASATTFTNRMGLGPFGFFSTDIHVVDRRKTVFTEQGAKNSFTSDMADISAILNPFQNALFFKTNYILSAERSQVLIKLYERVPEGYGTHIQEIFMSQDNQPDTIYRPAAEGEQHLADFIPSRLESYQVDTAHQPRNINRTEMGVRLDIFPRQYPPLKNLKGFLGDLSLSSYLRLEEEKIRDSCFSTFDLLFPNWRFNIIDSTDNRPSNKKAANAQKSIRGLMELRQDIMLTPKNSRFSLRIRINPVKIREFQSTHQQMDKMLYDITTRQRIWLDIGMLSQFTREENIQRNLYNYGHVLTHKAKLQFERNITKPLKTVLATAAGKSRQVLASDSSAVFFSMMPKLIFAIPGKGRFSSEYEYIHVFTGLINADYMMADGNAPGTTHRWAINGDYQFTKNVLLYIYYSGRRLHDRTLNRARVIHQGTVELKAFF